MTDDPWVMYLVVRKDHPITVAQAMALAGAGSVECADRFRPDPHWADAFRDWGVRPRKVALRADAEQVEELCATLDHAPVESEHGLTLLALPPRKRSQSEPLLAALRPYTDPPRNRAPGTPEPAAERAPTPLRYVIRPGVLRTAGKAMAQAGHAALLCADQLGPRRPEVFAAWRAAGLPGLVEEVDPQRWDELRPHGVVVTDAGLTQVAPGTETVLALPPTP